MKNRTFWECKRELDDYIGLESELEDAPVFTSPAKLLIYKAGKEKPVLLVLRIANYGAGWEIGAVEHRFKLEEISKIMHGEEVKSENENK